MKSLADGRILASAALVAAAMLVSGCASSKPMPPPQMPAPAAPSAGVTNVQPPSTPNTPTAANVNISPEILRACNIPDANAYFAFDSSQLTTFDATPLDQLATCFVRGPMAGREMRLVGHADPRGSADYNMTLGQSRADSVAQYLEAHGMGTAQVSTSSRGALDAVGHDQTGWAHDRRVDVLLGY